MVETEVASSGASGQDTVCAHFFVWHLATSQKPESLIGCVIRESTALMLARLLAYCICIAPKECTWQTPIADTHPELLRNEHMKTEVQF